MLRYLTAIGFLLCLFACSEEPAKDVEHPEEPPPTGGLAPSTAITFPDAKRFAPYEHKVKLTAEAKLPLKGNVPDRFMFSEDGRLLGVPRSPAGDYEFTVGEGKCSLKVVEQPHALPDVPLACDYACACAHEGKIYLFGGRADIADFTGFTHSFDPVTKKWEELPSMPHPKQRASAAALGGKIYVIGGYSGEESVLVDVFDPQKKAWSQGPLLSVARYAGCAVAVGGKIYYIGGWRSCHHEVSDGCGGEPSDAVEVFDPEKGAWEKGVSLPTARGYAACAAIGGKIYVAGGLGGDGELGVLEIFDTATGKWSRGPDAAAPVAYCGSCALAGRLFVFGGGREKEYLDEVVSFDPARGKWRAEVALDFAREALAAAAVGDKAYLLGGRVSGVYLPASEVYEALSALPGRGR